MVCNLLPLSRQAVTIHYITASLVGLATAGLTHSHELGSLESSAYCTSVATQRTERTINIMYSFLWWPSAKRTLILMAKLVPCLLYGDCVNSKSKCSYLRAKTPYVVDSCGGNRPSKISISQRNIT